MDPYLLGLRLRGRRIVVVGGGSVATRRVPALLDAGADILLVSPSVTTSLEDLAAAGRIRWAARRYEPGDCAGAWLVGAFTDSREVNAAVAAAAEEQRTWCVRADDAEASAAWTPASGRAGAVRVGVLSGDPRHSAAVRDAILNGLRSGQLPPRSPKGSGGSRGSEGKDFPPGSGGSGGSPPWASTAPGVGRVAIIGGGPGDPGLITVRGRQLLAEADVVVTDRLAPRSLLDELPADVEVIDASKIPYGRAMAQEHINAALVSHARAGRFVARLKGGDPFVFGRGAEEVLACLRAGVPVTVVPGVTSAVGVPASAWVPVTHRGIAQDFHVVSVHVPPDDERSTVDWEILGGSRGTLVLLMAVEHIGTVVTELLRHGRGPDTPVSVIADGTLPTQRTINSTLEQVERRVEEEGLRPPAVIVVGDVVGIAAEITELMRREAPGERDKLRLPGD
jgi:uroporphyrin-III C-methyltransferase / precorrin-2 dehydrogenase / sirohydrochlorin ferrochelatase